MQIQPEDVKKAAQKVYDLAKEAGFVKIPFDEVFTEETMDEFCSGPLPDTMLGGYFTVDFILEAAQKSKRYFFIDWRWDPEYLVLYIKAALPDLDIEFIKDKSYGRNDPRDIEIKINNNILNVKAKFPNEVVSVVNTYLDDVEFLYRDTGGDNYGFLLVNKDSIDEVINAKLFSVSVIK